jgi:hypothetical protein
VLWATSALCFVVGILVLVVPAGWTSLAVGRADPSGNNRTCTAIVPSASPFTPVMVAASRQPFVAAWDAYTARVLGRPEGVRLGCEPMRFPATSSYRGVAVLYHGFSSCPQEMAALGPALAAKGYDAVFPLLPAHGNELRYVPNAPNFLCAPRSSTSASLASRSHGRRPRRVGSCVCVGGRVVPRRSALAGGTPRAMLCTLVAVRALLHVSPLRRRG